MIEGMKQFLKGPAKYPIVVSLVAILLFLLGYFLLRNVDIPVLFPSGSVAKTESQLIIFTVMISSIVVIPVFVLLGIFAWRYRSGNTEATYKPEWDENNTLEIIWWSIPIIIICILGFLTWKTTHSLDPYRPLDSNKPTLEIDVVALQWKWLFIYPTQGVASVNEVVMPVDQPVRFKTTAQAPMSAFWIPALGSQIYSMEGMSSIVHLDATKEGTYTGYNTNINGKGYADMTFKVRAVDNSQFNQWIDGATKNDSLDMNSYQKLAQPGESKIKYYQLSDPKLFDRIVAQYMQANPANQKSVGAENSELQGDGKG